MRLIGASRPVAVAGSPGTAARAGGGVRAAVDRSRLVARRWTELTPAQVVRAVRRYRWTVLALVLLGGVGGGLAAAAQTPVYRAQARLVCSPNFPTNDVRQLDVGGNYILQRVRSYTEVADSTEVAAAVTARLGLPDPPEELLSRISVTSRASTAVLTVEVDDTDPERARDVANAVAEEIPAYIARIERPAGVDRSPVKVTVVRPAVAPESPDSPRPLTDVGLGLVGGLVVAAVTALGRYARDPAVRDAGHAAEVADLVPLADAGPVGPSPLTVDGTAERADELRRMRTDVRLQAAGGPLTTIAVVEPTAGGGATVTAAHLALAFAQAGDPVVLVDADPGRPSAHALFGIGNDTGLTTVLDGGSAVRDALVRWTPDLPLHVLPAGPGGPGPIRPDQLADLVAELRHDRTLVVVVGPPLLSDADTLHLVEAADATVVTARVGSTDADSLATAVRVLRQVPARLLGLVTVGRSG
ncbi:polysaccharide biosynthesis tyrosine autokinase [Micromonospora robiginosa]|uniref:Wzz/FepE/Etk N-terminal domain-containing protein n=1 Tax=Micromonospora robiginosa TaxID=2749844 RepID=A0A7L6BCT1_9ACTN|nr:polysaccharide biosynthesis tyrosine autokinase [Micromonospora ferruginea]QLQ39585.1 Wzz/FepE/Etk N-terminal domain-containing protein [Micromonospora ferruginea]